MIHGKPLVYQFNSLFNRLIIKSKKLIRNSYQFFYLLLFKKRISNYSNKVELIKKEFKYFYCDIGPESGTLQGLNYSGASTHCNQCLYTLARLTNSKNVLEIGSYHYRTSNQLGIAIDKNVGKYSEGKVITLDIIKGGYDSGFSSNLISNHRVKPYFWHAYKTKDTKNLSNLELDSKNMSNTEIVSANIELLTTILSGNNIDKLDLIFLDGDHTYEGLKNDLKIVKKFADKETLIVIDNIWDERMLDVKKVFDELKHQKWNFLEFNDVMFPKNKVQDTGIFIFD